MTDIEWAQVAPYMDGSRQYYDTLAPDYDGAAYCVVANVWSEEVNDYVAHFDGHVFDNYEMAQDFWSNWMPDMEAVRSAIREFHEDGYSTHYEVEVGIWENGELTREEDFYNEAVAWAPDDPER